MREPDRLLCFETDCVEKRRLDKVRSRNREVVEFLAESLEALKGKPTSGRGVECELVLRQGESTAEK